MDTLNDLLAASDLISLHCALTNETVQIMNADCLQHIKPGSLFFTMLYHKFLLGTFGLLWLALIMVGMALSCRDISC